MEAGRRRNNDARPRRVWTGTRHLQNGSRAVFFPVVFRRSRNRDAGHNPDNYERRLLYRRDVCDKAGYLGHGFRRSGLQPVLIMAAGDCRHGIALAFQRRVDLTSVFARSLDFSRGDVAILKEFKSPLLAKGIKENFRT
jgi:hypothetical protein